MTSFKDRLLDMFGPALLAKFRENFISCSPRRKPLPSAARPPPQRQLSMGSAIAAYRKAKAEDRLLASRQSLLGACVEQVVASVTCDPRRFGSQLRLLPPDLAQLVLDAIVAAAALNEATARCFRGLCVFELHLAGYPNMRNAWLADFITAQLTIADLRGCSKVGCATGKHDKASPST